jgi:putative glutamine amidotransferase
MTAKPFIGINLDCRFDRFSRRDFCAPQLPRWLDCIAQGGGIPLPVPPLSDLEDLNGILEVLDGFVFAGQNDSNSCLAMESGNDFSEFWEVRMLALIAERQLPLLSLGRGMQLLNLALGGTLEQEPTRHSRPGFTHVPRRPLSTLPGSLIAQISEARPVPVGSVHDSCVAELAAGLKATAWTDDGMIEAVENESSDWFAIGVQFVPEADALDDTDVRLFSALVQEAMAARTESAGGMVMPRHRPSTFQSFAEFAEPTPPWMPR